MEYTLDELEQLSKSATPLPWYVELHWESDPFSICHNRTDVCKAVSHNKDDAEYIAAACNSVPKLINDLRSAEEKIAELEEQKSNLINHIRATTTCKSCPAADVCTHYDFKSPTGCFRTIKELVESF